MKSRVKSFYNQKYKLLWNYPLKRESSGVVVNHVILSEKLLTLFNKGNYHLNVKSIRKSIVNNYFNIIINKKGISLPYSQWQVLKNKKVIRKTKMKFKDQLNDLLKILSYHDIKVNISIFHSILIDPLLIINYIQFNLLKKRVRLLFLLNRLYKVFRKYLDKKQKEEVKYKLQYFLSLSLYVELLSLFHFFILNQLNRISNTSVSKVWHRQNFKLKSSLKFIKNNNVKKWQWKGNTTYKLKKKDFYDDNLEFRKKMYKIYEKHKLKKNQTKLTLKQRKVFNSNWSFLWGKKDEVGNHFKVLIKNPHNWYMDSTKWYQMFYILRQTNRLRYYFTFFFNSKWRWKKWSRKQKFKKQFEVVYKKYLWKKNRLKIANLKRRNKLFYFWMIQSKFNLINKKMVLKFLYKNKKMLSFLLNYFESIFFLQNWMEKQWLKHHFMQNLILNELKLYNLNYIYATKLQGFWMKLKGPIRMKKLDRSKKLIKTYGNINLNKPDGCIVEYKNQIWTKLGTLGAHFIIH